MNFTDGGLLAISTTLAFWTSIATVAYVVITFTYNVLFHPLRSYPGPLLWRATRIPYHIKVLSGTLSIDMLDLHKKYGPVVRIAPNELAFANASAWKEILGHNPKGEECGKWVPFYRPVPEAPDNIISAERQKHGIIRRQLAHGFSDKSMREQEPIIRSYVDLLMKRLRENCAGGQKPVDMTAWFNFTTFDVIGDLALGESFGCLEESNWHSWVKTIFYLAELGAYMQSAAHYPTITKSLLRLVPKSLMKSFNEHAVFTQNRVAKRMELGKVRHDLIEGLIMKQEDWQMPQADIESHAGLLIIAGSETTATLLSGCLFLLLNNPDTLAKLTNEIRSAFTEEEEITIASAGQLEYMLACLDEALRCYPPVPLGNPRVVPKGGKVLCGKYVPEDTHVAIWQWATYHSEENFVEPFKYLPERWLKDGNPKFANDKKESMQPFSFGPRNCIGRNLAYAEMRTIMARLIFNFDLKLAPESRGWLDQKVFNLWQKPPLMVHLTPRAQN
ncbi:hypothetical protein KVR01_011824 [Diaporthe batatas]|uniref:uncharacterized protein n=1 Tax=Diaporthe batatas TaxID=748121 RepID=UPI001D04920C|nr:uncharacterized protein KVR01_011824 [Diaporthe batatas]KAG8158063.1 hypothetical protein KVR01_011824 [Diaporthe batatas]